ncbi:unnamed protein product [Eruca vesicaria subsp. sativa]|uniref:Uncharacterized protein n=1 Tax=Eruca vesicaria subsp. sativa TaxID=29727 RepID=A0ABC8LJV5_ERUVS|nr:unnamed protein product [Eruca vesicaria subsp. sativa]
MQTVWNVPGHTSGENPTAFPSGEPPPILPPDPPDRASSLSPVNFPTLSDSTTKTALSTASRKGHRKLLLQNPTAAVSPGTQLNSTTSIEISPMDMENWSSKWI